MDADGVNKQQADRPNEGGPPAISPSDPVAPATHTDGGTYAEGDFSVAAQRSKLHTDQHVPGPPHLASRTEERGSGLDGAEPYEPVGGQSTQ